MTCWRDGDDWEKATARLVMQRTDRNVLESIMSKTLKPTLLLGRVQPGRPLGSMSVLYQWRFRQNDYTNSLYSRGSIAFAYNMVKSGCPLRPTGLRGGGYELLPKDRDEWAPLSDRPFPAVKHDS